MTKSAITREKVRAVREYVSTRRGALTINVSVMGAPGSGRHGLYLSPSDYDWFDNGQWSLMTSINDHAIILRFSSQRENQVELRENHHWLYLMYVREAEAVLLVYDVSKRVTFDWLDCAYRELLKPQRKLPIWVCASRTERPQEEWAVSMEEAKEFCKKIGAKLFTFSAKNGKHIDTKFGAEIATAVIWNKIKDGYVGAPSQPYRVEDQQIAQCVPMSGLLEILMSVFRGRS